MTAAGVAKRGRRRGGRYPQRSAMNGPLFPSNAEMTTESFESLPRIVAVQGGALNLIQALLSQLAVSWRARGLRIAGVVEEFPCENARETVVLRDLTSGASYRKLITTHTVPA